MSGEAGGIIGLIIVAALVGPAIAAALAFLVAGAVVVGAVTAAVAAARVANKGIRALHRKHMQDRIHKAASSATSASRPAATTAQPRTRAVPQIQIVKTNGKRVQTAPAGQTAAQRSENRALMERVNAQRNRLLKVYEEQSERLEQLSLQQERERNALVELASNADAQRVEQLEALQERAETLRAQTAQQLTAQMDSLRVEMDEQIENWSTSVSEMLAERRAQIEQRLEILDIAVERSRAAGNHARSLLTEADELYEQLLAEEDAQDLVGGHLSALAKLRQDCLNLLNEGQGQAAIASAVSFTQMTMETYNRLDMELHRRELMTEQLNLSSAALRAMVESGCTIELSGAKQYPKEADYWVSGRLAPIVERAKELLAAVDAKTSRTAAAQERLVAEINRCTEEMDELLSESRQALGCAYLRMQLMAKAREGFAASGWKAVDWGFEQKDFRRPVIARFVNGAGATADLLIRPVYDAVNRRYDIDVKVERRDPGVIDERLRAAQIRQLEQNLNASGVPVKNMRCIAGTEGRNALGPAVQNRFGLPDSGTNATGNH